MPQRPSAEVVTLVSAADTELARWNANARAGRYIVLETIDKLEDAVRSPRKQAGADPIRVVIDGGIDLDRFLMLVASVPDTFHGELLYIRRDGSGYLSTRELGTMRTVKTISEMDVEVYLRWNGLPARSRASYEADSQH
jgi:hypothetical protein